MPASLRLDGMIPEADCRPIRRRARNAKSRNGCGTCKKRHVKCDEIKPLCNQCIKFGIECDGYQIPRQVLVVMAKARPLVSKPPAEHLIYSPSTHLFANDEEFYSFKRFCNKTAPQISGFFDSSLWSRLVPQACDVDPAIRHAVVAIGALDYFSEISRSIFTSSRGILDKNYQETQKYHRFALRQYSAAIRQIRSSASERKIDIRKALLSCILITCFEILHGNYHSAIAQIQSGIGLLEEWQMQNKEEPGNILGVSSPSPLVVEAELVQALGRLDIQVMSFVDIRSRETHNRMRHYGSSSIRSMPTNFSNLKEARIYLEVIMRRIMHFRPCLSSSKQNGCLSITFPSANLLEGALNDQKAYVAELQGWHYAFKPLWDRSRTQHGTSDFYVATALRVHYLTSYFVINAIPLDSLEARTFTARATPICEEMVSLSHILLKKLVADDAKFSFDLHVVPLLYIMGMRCPDSKTRRAAIALLLALPRREGLWDGGVVGKALKWVADLEEEDSLEKNKGLDGRDLRGLDEASGHRGNGVVGTVYNFDTEARRVRVKCWRAKIGQERMVEREIEIPW